ncbi:MAG: SGNH hydrolase domain-containing protein [Myxococcota bacterium]
MYNFVENPLRAKKKKGARNYYFISVLFGIVILLIAGKFQSNLFSKKEVQISNAWLDCSVYRCGKLIRILKPGNNSCNLTKSVKNPEKKLLLVGDSHTDAIKSTFVEVSEKNNVSLRLMVRIFTLGKGIYSPAFVINEAKKYNIDYIVLHDLFNNILIDPIRKIVKLAEKNDLKIIYIDPVPVWEQHIPKALWNNLKKGTELPRQTRQDYIEKNKKILNALDNIKSKNFIRYSTLDYLCPDKCMITDPNGKPLYLDEHHLTLTGSRYLKPLLEKIVTR